VKRDSKQQNGRGGKGEREKRGKSNSLKTAETGGCEKRVHQEGQNVGVAKAAGGARQWKGPNLKRGGLKWLLW